MRTLQTLDKPCKEWTRAKLAGGYGIKAVNGKVKTVHRAMWEENNAWVKTSKEII